MNNFICALASMIITHCLIFQTIVQVNNYIIVKKIDRGKILYEKYRYDGQHALDISDLTVWDRAFDNEEILNTFYHDPGNIRVLLLQNGYAKLNKIENADPKEVLAQNSAQSARLRIWQQSSDNGGGLQKDISWSIMWNYIWQSFIFLLSIGVVGAICKKAYKVFYIQRRIKLLVIGEPSTGKTALITALIDPHVSKKELLNTKVSKAVNRQTGITHIPRGKFEIIPEITDVPGSSFASVWDKLIGDYNHALLIVICPKKDNGVSESGNKLLLDVSSGIDQKYVGIQIGYVQAYVEGGVGAKQTKKPKLVILFINKFDIYSNTPPNDSASLETKKELERVFHDHIISAESAAKKAGIPIEVVFGSAVEKWNIEQIISIVVRTLYKI